MKTVLTISLIVILAATASAADYYCVPILNVSRPPSALICVPVDFETRTIELNEKDDMKPTTVCGCWDGNHCCDGRRIIKQRCYSKQEGVKLMINCKPYDDDAVILETPKSCPENNNKYWWNGLVPTSALPN